MSATECESYKTQCWSCKQPFDALEAGWCGTAKPPEFVKLQTILEKHLS